MEVTWDSEKFYVDLPVGSLTLGSLKSYLSSRTGVLPQHMKLFCNGGLMKDDNAPLSSYRQELAKDSDSAEGQSSGLFQRHGFWSGILAGVRKNQRPPMKIRMVGSQETRAVVSDRPDLSGHSSQDETANELVSGSGKSNSVLNESSVTFQIQELSQKTINESLPKVEKLERRNLTDNPESTTADKVDGSYTEFSTKDGGSAAPDEFACLSEMLLQSLLKLDGFQIESDWTEARSARKEGVRAVQGLLDRLDQTKAKGRLTSHDTSV